MTPRKKFTNLQRAKIFDRVCGVCHICEQGIQVGQPWDVEHIRPLSMGGTNDDANLAPAHEDCHGEKSKREATAYAKVLRIRAKHIGAHKSTGWQRKYRKKMNGEVVLR